MTKRSSAETCREVLDLLEHCGKAEYYGEPVTQLQHALQAAYLAACAGADSETVLAALLHDVGHLLDGDHHEEIGVIDHDARAMEWLRERGFGARLIELVGGHVAAKRYLVATNAGYRDRLSQASRRTLELQGGLMTPEEVSALERHPLFREMLRLRSWDEQAKDPHASVPALSSYHRILEEHLELQSVA